MLPVKADRTELPKTWALAFLVSSRMERLLVFVGDRGSGWSCQHRCGAAIFKWGCVKLGLFKSSKMFWLRKSLFCFNCKSLHFLNSSVSCPLLSSAALCAWWRSQNACCPLLTCCLTETPFLPPVAELFRLAGWGLSSAGSASPKLSRGPGVPSAPLAALPAVLGLPAGALAESLPPLGWAAPLERMRVVVQTVRLAMSGQF